MFHFKIYEHKTLYGMYYTFPTIGDGIAMHDHTEEQKHNIIILKGSIEIYGPNKSWQHIINAGEVMDLLDSHHPHEIYALEDNTVCLSMFVNGKPDGDKWLTDGDKQGTILNKMPAISR